jgi:hypothetical protein
MERSLDLNLLSVLTPFALSLAKTVPSLASMRNTLFFSRFASILFIFAHISPACVNFSRKMREKNT